MTIQILRNIRVPEDLPAEADLAMASLSVESRCANVFGNVSPSSRTRLAIVEHESPLPSFTESESCFRSLDFVRVNETVLEATLDASIASLDKASLVAIVDISCMSRDVMARLFAWFLKLTPSIELNLYVCYSLAEFSAPPTEYPPNEYIAPVASRFAGWPSASQPTSLVVGLGYEPHKAEGAAEFLDASEQWLFVPNSPIGEFRDAVERNNEGLVERARRANRLVEYQLEDPAGTYGQLELLVSDLSRRSNPVLLPFGPKMFFALNLLQSYEHAQAGVWAVSGERTAPSVDRRASGRVIGFQAKLQ